MSSARGSAVAAAALVMALLAVPQPATAVSGGHRVSWRSYPWVAGLGTDMCGGVLVASDRVLTSAGCAEDTEGWPVRIGLVHRRAVASSFPPAAIAELLAGPRRDCGGYEDTDCIPDAAIMRLSAPVTGVPIPRLLPPRPGRHGFLVGMGTTASWQNGTEPAHLHAARLLLMSDASCVIRYAGLGRSWAADVNPDVNFCARDAWPPRTASLCLGDPGAPLLARSRHQWRLLGVASWDESCGEGDWPTVFVDAWDLRAFILQPAPVWRPTTSKWAHISGAGRVGATLTCHAPPFNGVVDSVFYLFQDTYDEGRALQRGPAPTYVVPPADRGATIGCEAYAVNQGGVARAVIPGDGIAIK